MCTLLIYISDAAIKSVHYRSIDRLYGDTFVWEEKSGSSRMTAHSSLIHSLFSHYWNYFILSRLNVIKLSYQLFKLYRPPPLQCISLSYYISSIQHVCHYIIQLLAYSAKLWLFVTFIALFSHKLSAIKTFMPGHVLGLYRIWFYIYKCLSIR